MSDDDWFERALSEDDEESPADEPASGDDNPFGDGDAAGGDEADAAFGESSGDTDGNPVSEGAEDEAADDPFGGDGADSDGEGSHFAEDAASSFGEAESDDEGVDAGDDTVFDEGAEDAFGEAGSGGDPFGDDDGFGGGGGDGGLFDDDGFASAMEGGGGDDEFDGEDFDSDIPRIDLGIEGLDQMIQGGIPERHLMVVVGSAGTGKTTFGLQFLQHGLQQGENAVFITLEQSREAIVSTAKEFGWDFDGYEEENRLAVVDLDPVEMANSLDNIQAELPQLIQDFDADRLVLDSVSLLEMMYDDQARRRTEVFDFTRALKKAGVTTFLTSEASETNPYASRHGIIEYLTDAVCILQYVRGETQETRLAVEIMKIRNANHSREKKPYEMGENGLSVYQQANIF